MSEHSRAASEDSAERLMRESRWLRLLLVHLAGPRVRARVEVDDLMQEVFLRALSSPSGLPSAECGGDALRRYLARVARHTVFDVLRAARAAKRAGKEVRLTRADWSAPGLSESQLRFDAPGPATRAIEAEERQDLLIAFEKLSPEHRRVIGLRQLEGLSAAETAKRMRRSETAVHSLYRRALEAWHRTARR